jgi:hypothetical protein
MFSKRRRVCEPIHIALPRGMPNPGHRNPKTRSLHMTITTRNIAALPRPVRDVAPAQFIPAERAEVARRAQEAAGRAAFFEDMEMAMTCLVLIGALLFTAGLIRYGAPAGQVRDTAAAIFYALAAFSGAGLALFTLISICRRVLLPARRRG